MPLLATREEKDIYINEIASKMSYVDTRKKGRVDISGILAVINHLQSYNIDVDISYSAHKISSILEEFSITDIYCNNYRIDVITVLQDGVAAVPKKHFEYDIAADFYYFIKIEQDLTNFEVLGYLPSQEILNSKSDSNFYYPKEFSCEKELIELIQKQKSPKTIVGNHKDCEALFLRFLDKELSYSYKKSFIKHLLSCRECLEKFRYLDSFNNSAKSATDCPELIEKYYKKATGQLSNTKNSYSGGINLGMKDIKAGIINFIKNIFSKISVLLSNKKSFDSEILQNEEECIDLIFNHNNQEKTFNITNAFKRKKIGVLILIPILLISFLIFGIIKFSSHSNEQELPQEEFVDDNFQQFAPIENEFSQSWDSEIREPAEIAQIHNKINKISWEIPKKLSGNNLYIKFLQIAGKNIQVNLENDLLVMREIPTNHSVKVNVVFKNYGSIVSLKTIKGSGSNEIDNVIEKTVFSAFSYVRPPQTDLKNVDLTLLIEF